MTIFTWIWDIGVLEHSATMAEKNDHDKKIEKLNKQTFKIERKPDEAERNFFKQVNAIDEEFNGARTGKK